MIASNQADTLTSTNQQPALPRDLWAKRLTEFLRNPKETSLYCNKHGTRRSINWSVVEVMARHKSAIQRHMLLKFRGGRGLVVVWGWV